MTNFDKSLQQLDEIHCWKGYRKVGTKMKGGKRVNDCRKVKKVKESIFVPTGDTENYFAKKLEPVISKIEYSPELQSDFNNLPSAPPYGFWVDKEGKFVATPSQHDPVLVKVWPELQSAGVLDSPRLQMAALKTGLIKMTKTDQNTYSLIYHPIYVTRQAINTANDIAKYYNMSVHDEFKVYKDEVKGGA